MTKTTTIFPPEILEYFDSKLLERPRTCNSEKIYNVFQYIKCKLMNKASYNTIWEEKCKKLEKEFLELYERAKEKEEDIKTEANNKTKEPFYFLECSDRRNDKIFERLRSKAYRYSSKG